MSPAYPEYNIDEVLAQFPGPVSIYPDRRKVIAVTIPVAIIVGLVVVAVYSKARGPLEVPLALFCVVFFGLAIARMMAMLIWRLPLVTLRADGVSLFTAGLSLATGFKPRNLPWHEIKRIYVTMGGVWLGPRSISINYLFADKRPQMFPYTSLARIQPGSLDQLVQLLTLWRERALAASNQSASAAFRGGFAPFQPKDEESSHPASSCGAHFTPPNGEELSRSVSEG
jgi:hypothetical protein